VNREKYTGTHAASRTRLSVLLYGYGLAFDVILLFGEMGVQFGVKKESNYWNPCKFDSLHFFFFLAFFSLECLCG